ncbi:MAG TPA: pitrilysin family protein, partial [Candidatus Xenobia bacterium]
MKATKVLIALVSVFLTVSVAWSSPASGLHPTRYVLDNGMVVIFQQNHTMPLVSLNILVRSGGMYEDASTNGLSHFYEHMFFRGTPSRTGIEIKQDLEGLGGSTNAETSKDFTHFFVNMPSTHTREGLAILADALMNANFDPKNIDLERNAVLDEYRMDQEEPGQIMQADLYGKAFPDHPYRLPVIGTEANIKRFEQADFLAWKAKYYVPERTALVVVGDFDPDQLLPYVKDLFKDWKSAGIKVDPVAQDQPIDKIRELSETRDLNNGYVLLGFHSPSVKDKPDIYAVDVMTFLLGQGEGCLAQKVLVDKKSVASEASADFLTQRDPGLIILEADTTPAQLSQAKQALLDLIEEVRHDQFSAADFARAKNLLTNTYVMDNETDAGKADGLGFYEMIDRADFATSYL